MVKSVAIITPWMVKCGIYTYSEKLAKALAEKIDVYIVRLPRFGVKDPEVFRNVAESVPEEAEIFHVQHEYGLYNNVDILFYQTLQAYRKPIVTTMHAVGSIQVDNVVAAISKRVIVHNDYCKKRFMGDQKNLTIIPHGTSPVQPSISSDVAKRNLGISPEIPTVGYCGFISAYKGLEVLIQTMQNTRAVLLVAGGYHAGPDTDYILKLKERSMSILSGRVQWLGFIPEERLASTYAAMDVVVYPSRFATESGALLMALSHGKVVLASNLPPFKEKEKKGALMTYSSPSDLTRKLDRLLRNENLRKQFEEAAKQYAEEYAWPKIAEKHIKLYEETLEKNNVIKKS